MTTLTDFIDANCPSASQDTPGTQWARDAREWAATAPEDPQQAWDECPSGRGMLCLLSAAGLSPSAEWIQEHCWVPALERAGDGAMLLDCAEDAQNASADAVRAEWPVVPADVLALLGG